MLSLVIVLLIVAMILNYFYFDKKIKSANHDINEAFERIISTRSITLEEHREINNRLFNLELKYVEVPKAPEEVKVSDAAVSSTEILLNRSNVAANYIIGRPFYATEKKPKTKKKKKKKSRK